MTTIAEKLTIVEKIKLLSLAPYTVPLSIAKHYFGTGIPGGYIAGFFVKQ